jgi:hypothetical protein
LRRVLRYDILAIVANGAITAFGLVMLPCGSLAPAAWVPYALAIGAAWSLHAFVIVRFGFLPFFVAWTTVNVLYNLPLTTHLTAPCLDGTLVGLGVVLSVALVGFDMTLGGRPRRAVLQWIRGG